MMLKNWVLREPVDDPEVVEQGLHPLVRTILAARCASSSQEPRLFLAPALADMHDPMLLKGIPAAIDRLIKARCQGETVCIYGDYDVDGIAGTSLLVSFMRTVGFSCLYFIPNRFNDGYGLSCDAIDSIEARGAGLIVTVDCGITAVEEAIHCRKRGVDLIIVDHHAPGPDIPDAVAVVNPMQPECAYPYKYLAGVGVAFNLLVALRAALRDQGLLQTGAIPDLRHWLDLVALGTIADVVPLTGQNRIYVAHGLRLLSTSTKPGIQALKRVAGLTDKVSCGQVGFKLAPRLNAGGRLESAVPGVELLLGTDPDEMLRLAGDLDTANAERRAIEQSMVDEAVRMVEAAGLDHRRHSIVLAHEAWHQGVVGIVASRLVERYHRPTILFALTEDGMAKGSGRSIPGFHLLDALGACRQHLHRFGGHRHAAGVGLRAELIPAFAEAFELESSRLLAADDLIPRLQIDVEAQPADITPALLDDLSLLEPFGAGNPEPVLMMRRMTVVEQRSVGEGHLRLRLMRDGHTFSAIAFRFAGRRIDQEVDIAFYPELNQWNGRSSLQLRIKDLRQAE